MDNLRGSPGRQDIDEPGSTEVLAFSSSGALLFTQRATLRGINRITIRAADIHSFLVRSTGIEDSGWAIDNLQFAGFAAGQGAQAVRPLVTNRPSGPRGTRAG